LVTNLAAGEGLLAVVRNDHRVLIYEAADGRLRGTPEFPSGPSEMAFGNGRLWVAESFGRVSAVDIDSQSIAVVTQLGCTPQAIQVGKEHVWVACWDNTLRIVDK
jgi:hypothetical protein